MKQYYQTAVRHPHVMEDGKTKNITEQLLVDALSFGEAEIRTVEYAAKAFEGDIVITKDAKTNITDVIRCDTRDINVFWKAKVYFITLDEKSGREKKSACNMLVEAENLADVSPRIVEYLKKSVVDYEIGSIQETKFVEVIEYESTK